MNVTINSFKRILPLSCVKQNEPLSFHTSFNIGGECSWFISPQNINQLKRLMAFIKSNNLSHFILGAGSNVLASDNGFVGIVVSLSNFNNVKIKKQTAVIGAGLNVSSAIARLKEYNLGGLEFLAGVPASIGGAVYMNAGAFGFEMADFVASVTVLKDGKVITYKNSDCNFGYRTSRFISAGEIILLATFTFNCIDAKIVQEKILEFVKCRQLTQPNLPSAGSVFKRTENFPAGFLIEQAGLKGFKLNNAQISSKHANFIVNLGGATSQDILKLIEIAKQEVYLQFGIKLEQEIIYLGGDT